LAPKYEEYSYDEKELQLMAYPLYKRKKYILIQNEQHKKPNKKSQGYEKLEPFWNFREIKMDFT
jgi:hypothetical protein